MIERISDLLDERHVSLAIAAKRKPEIIQELVGLLAASGTVPDGAAIAAAVIEREALVSTAVGGGIALPHCLTPLVTTPTMVIGRKPEGARFDAVDKLPVRLFFLIVGPANGQTDHLRLLSKLARLLHDPELKAGLLAAPTPAAVLDLFRRREKPSGG